MTDRDRFRSGIIGTGFIGTVHARAVHAAGGLLSAVTTSHREESRKAAVRLGADRAVASAEEIIGDADIDIVHICTPNSLHVDLALRALAAGKHVICEKPLAVSPDGAEKLVRAAEEAGTTTVVPFIYRFYPAVREARARVSAGDLGKLRLLHGSYLQDWMASLETKTWRTDASLSGPSRAFADIGIHWCDLVEFVSGHHISRLSARTSHVRDSSNGDEPNEDIATIVFETAEGALGSLVVSQVARGRKNRLWVSFDGDNAAVWFNQEDPDWLWVAEEKGNCAIPRGAAVTSQEALRLSMLPVGHPQGYQDCFNALVSDTYSAIKGNRPEGLPTFADGYKGVRLTQALIESHNSGMWIEVA